jgi:hypothetical protein
MNEETLKQIIEIYQQKTFDLFNRNVALEAQISYLQKQLSQLQQEESEDEF